MKRKILTLGLAACLFFQSTGIVALATESQIIEPITELQMEEYSRSVRLDKPTNLIWKEKTGTICWDEVAGAEGSYATILKKDGNSIGTIEPYDNPESKGTYEYYYGPLIEENGAGTYTFQVKAVGQEGASDSDWEDSAEFIYTVPSNSLSAPTNLRWDTIGERIYACWDKVEGAAGYQVEFSYDNQYVEGDWAATFIEYKGSGSCKIDFTDNVYYGEDYYFRVSALSPDICSKRSSVFSTMSEKYDASTALKDASDAVENVLGKIDKLEDNDDIIYAVDDLVDNIGNKIGELAAAMRSDENSLSNMQKLEEAYTKASNIQVENNVAKDISIDTDKISITGAALNAGTNTNISLNFNKLSENSGIDKSDWQYKNTIEFDIDLTGTDSESITLKVPVHITMPVPAGIDIDKLEILHYTSKNTYERLELTKDHGNNTVSFVVTSFSPFVFGELENGGSVTLPKEPDEEVEVIAPIYNLNITNVLVPTNFSMAFNPNGIDITKKEGVVSNEQVVSLNYGIIQKSSKDKKITVNFKVEDENNRIVFATDENEVKNAADDTYVVHLQAIPSTDIKIDNAAPTKDTKADKLGDVEMKPDETHIITANENSFSFIMDKASYKTIGDIELGTGTGSVNNDISDKVIIDALGTECSSVGFTFTGSMNTNTDWSKLDKGIKVSVTYDIEDIYNVSSGEYGLVQE